MLVVVEVEPDDRGYCIHIHLPHLESKAIAPLRRLHHPGPSQDILPLHLARPPDCRDKVIRHHRLV